MADVMIVGIDPDQVDFSDPSLPPGLTAEAIRRGIVTCQRDLRAAGHSVRHRFIPPDQLDLAGFAAALEDQRPDCIVIGGGVRLPPQNLLLFERVVNIVAQASGPPAIALASRPEDAAIAVARVFWA